MNDFRRHPFYDQNPELEEVLKEYLALASWERIQAFAHLPESLRAHLSRFQQPMPFDDLLDKLEAEKGDLRGVDLSGLMLCSAERTIYLDKAHLEGADLRWAYLKCAFLYKVYLQGADLEGAYLESVGLEGAHLEGAGLKRTNLEAANLREAHLEGANLFGAHLENAKLIGAYLESVGLEGAHLEGANLWGAHLEGANLWGAHLEGANLRMAHLEGANLRMAYLEGADFTDAVLTDANLTDARLSGANLSSANLTGATVRGAEFRRVSRSPESKRSHFYRLRSYLSFGKRTSSADLSDAIIENVKGGRDTYWPGPLAVRKTHNTDIPSLTGARAKLAFGLLGSITAIVVVINQATGLIEKLL